MSGKLVIGDIHNCPVQPHLSATSECNKFRHIPRWLSKGIMGNSNGNANYQTRQKPTKQVGVKGGAQKPPLPSDSRDELNIRGWRCITVEEDPWRRGGSGGENAVISHYYSTLLLVGFLMAQFALRK